jgi:hypothetical protein
MRGTEYNAHTYTVNDGSGAVNSSADGSVTLNITGGTVAPPPPPTPNNAPDAADLVVSANATSTDITINLLDLTSDLDGDDLSIQSVSIDIGGTPVTFSLVDGVLVVPGDQFVSISGSITTAFTYVVDDGTGTANSSATGHVNLTINGPFGASNIAPVAQETEQSVLVEDGVFTVDLNTLVSDGNGDPLTLSDITLTYFADGVVTAISVPFTNTGGVITIDPADFGLADGESLTAQLNFVVDDGTGAPNSSDVGGVMLLVTDQLAVPPTSTQYVLDFEPFDNPSDSTTAITEYQGFHFLGNATVFEVDEVANTGDGRDSGLLGVGNGQTTAGGTNVLVGGEGPEHVFSIVAQGGDLPGVPVVTPNFGATFSLDGLSLNAAFNNGLTVTITTCVVGLIDISGNFGFPAGTIFEDGLVVADTFDFIVSASDGASVIIFDNFVDAHGAIVVGSTAFDNIVWVDITSAGGTDAGLGGTGTQFVLDDILITV